MLAATYLSNGLLSGLHGGKPILNVKDLDMIKIHKKRF